MWYANPPFRVNHCAKRTMELEWEDESSKGGSILVPVNATYISKGKYRMEVVLSSPHFNLNIVFCFYFEFSLDILLIIPETPHFN